VVSDRINITTDVLSGIEDRSHTVGGFKAAEQDK
jgi:hypothetical protein